MQDEKSLHSIGTSASSARTSSKRVHPTKTKGYRFQDLETTSENGCAFPTSRWHRTTLRSNEPATSQHTYPSVREDHSFSIFLSLSLSPSLIMRGFWYQAVHSPNRWIRVTQRATISAISSPARERPVIVCVRCFAGRSEPSKSHIKAKKLLPWTICEAKLEDAMPVDRFGIRRSRVKNIIHTSRLQ